MVRLLESAAASPGTVWPDQFEFKELSPLPDPFVAVVRESNRQGLDGWDRYAAHRERLTRILTAVAGGRSSLCILGAGNLNDLHLDRLLGCYARLDLVDLDVGAVRAAVARRRPDRPAQIRVHGPVDLSGILLRLPTAGRAGDIAEELCGALAGHRCAVEGQPFDVTVSTGLLTQLLQSVVDSSLPPPDTVAVRLALRDKHLADLVRLTRPGGTVVLVTDVVSTSTAPDLLDAGPAQLEQRLAELVARQNFFTGTNPYRIMAVLEEDERLRGLVTGLRLLRPWLWQVTPDRHHLTVAVVAQRTAAPAYGPLPL